MTNRPQLTPLPEGFKITRCPPGRAKGAELPGEFVGTQGPPRGSVDPFAPLIVPSWTATWGGFQ